MHNNPDPTKGRSIDGMMTAAIYFALLTEETYIF